VIVVVTVIVAVIAPVIVAAHVNVNDHRGRDRSVVNDRR